VPATLYQVDEAGRAKVGNFTGTLPAARRCASVPAVGGTDALLASRLTAGDDLALAEAFDRFGAAVYGAARRVTGDGASAQDVAQDVFVNLWSQPGRYDPAAGSLRTYLVVLARRRAVDLIRSELRRIARQERHHRLAPGRPASSPGDDVLAADMAATIRAAVRALPESQRRVVELAYFEGLSYREVAAAAGIPEGTAKSRIRLALAKLETALGCPAVDRASLPVRRPGGRRAAVGGAGRRDAAPDDRPGGAAAAARRGQGRPARARPRSRSTSRSRSGPGDPGRAAVTYPNQSPCRWHAGNGGGLAT